MQSLSLDIDDSINIVEFIDNIQSIYGKMKIKKSLSNNNDDDKSNINWDELFPPLVDTSVWKFNREEANER